MRPANQGVTPHQLARRLDDTKAIAVVAKASTLTGNVVPDLCITTNETIPERKSLQEYLAAYHSDARQIVEAMLLSLPGGTVDAVLRLLLEHRALGLSVSMREAYEDNFPRT